MNSHPLVLFDGVCNFCNASINLIIRQDREGRIRFVPLQSAYGEKVLEQYQLPPDYLQSFVFIDKGKVYTRSDAALRIVHHLPWYWKWLKVFHIVPRPVRNAVYNFIAKNRYKWFGKKEVCMVPTPELRSRFLV